MDIDISFSLSSLVELFNKLEIKSNVQPSNRERTTYTTSQRGQIKRSPRCRPFPSPISSHRVYITGISDEYMQIDSKTDEDDIECQSRCSPPSSRPKKLFRTIQFTQERYPITPPQAQSPLSKGPTTTRRKRLPLQLNNRVENLSPNNSDKNTNLSPENCSKRRFKISRLTAFAR
jgi:hypothetical protein